MDYTSIWFYVAVFLSIFFVYRKEVIEQADELYLLWVIHKMSSYEWKFTEQLVEDLSSLYESDTYLQAVLRRELGEDMKSNVARLALVNDIVRSWKEIFQNELIMYSRHTLSMKGFIFRILPSWKVAECELLLNDLPASGTEIYFSSPVPSLVIDQSDMKLIQSDKAGLTLCRFRKKPFGNKKGDDRKSQDNYGLRPAIA